MVVMDLETASREDVMGYIEAPDAPSNYRDETKIAAYKAEALQRALDKAACAPDLNRIILAGWIDAKDVLHQLVARDQQDERELVEEVWTAASLEFHNSWSAKPQLVTFGGWGFDWPTLARRSQLLGVRIPAWVSWDKYRSAFYQGDLAHVLTFGGVLGQHRSLRTYMRLFGLPVPAEDHDGSAIAALWDAGDIDAIRAKNRIDLEGTYGLSQRLLVPQTTTVAS